MNVEVYIIIVIGILSAMTLNRGIHLYFTDRYEKISDALKKNQLFSNNFWIRSE